MYIDALLTLIVQRKHRAAGGKLYWRWRQWKNGGSSPSYFPGLSNGAVSFL